VASSSEAVFDETRDDSNSHDNTAQSADSLSNYDATHQLSSSLGHLQLECVPEHLTELEEEVECAASEVTTSEETSQRTVHESDAANMATAAAAAAVSSDDGLQQLAADENISAASVHATTDTSAHVESETFRFARAYIDYSDVQ